MVVNQLTVAAAGALIGSIGTFSVRWWFRRKENRERIDTLRRSLIIELGSMDELANEKGSLSQIPAHNIATTEVYESNSSEISLLTPMESKSLIRFYSNAISTERTIENIRSLLIEEDDELLTNNFQTVRDNLESLREDWKRCVLALLSNLDDFPSEVRVDKKNYSVDESMPAPDLWTVLNHWRLDNSNKEVEFIY